MNSIDQVDWRVRNDLTGFVVVFLMLWGIGGVTQAVASDFKRPNVLLIVADDLGFSDLGCYGGEIQTPVLDELAKGGAQLTRMYSTGRCCPSRAALLTGQYPHSVGLGHMTIDLDRPGYRGRVADDADTIAEILERSGYSTWLSGKWHLGTADPTQHGFEEFFGTLVSCKDFWSPERFYRIQRGETVDWDQRDFFATDAVTEHAIQFLNDARQASDESWFGYVAYHAPHFPLHAPAEDIAEYEDVYTVGWDIIREQRLIGLKKRGLVDESTKLPSRSRYADWAESDSGEVPAWDSLSEVRKSDLARRMAIYAAMVDRLDRQIGLLIDNLKAAGEFENTLVVFLSDNGACAEWDPFGFDGVSGPDNKLHVAGGLQGMGQKGTFHSVGAGWAMASNTPFRRFKHYCHEGGIRGPAIVHWPAGSVEAGQVVHDRFHLIDLLPTIAAAASATDFGPRVPAGVAMPFVFDRPEFDRAEVENARQIVGKRTLFFEHEGNRAAIDSTNTKIVSVRGEDWQAYDLMANPSEIPQQTRRVSGQVSERLTADWINWASKIGVTPFPEDYGVSYLSGSRDGGKDRMRDNRAGNNSAPPD